MARRNGIVFVIILVIFALTVWAVMPNSTLSESIGREGMRLGLDLVGGVHLVYQVNTSDNASVVRVDDALVIIQKRIDTYGVTEPIIQKVGADRIMVQLPGFTDIEAAKKLVEQTGFLEFREVEKNTAGALVYLKDYLSANVTGFLNQSETGNRVFVTDEADAKGTKKPVVFLTKDESGLVFTDVNGNVADNATLQKYKESPAWIVSRGTDGTPLTGDLLSDAQPDVGGSLGTTPQVNITWDDEGGKIFDQIAARLYDPLGDQGSYKLEYVLGIFLDNALISAPKINSSSFQGKGTISGSFTVASAEELANLLKSGALPVQLIKPPLFQEKVSATLGAEFITMSWKAGLVAILLVMLFMIAYYRLPGLMASLALIFYGTLTLAICKLWPITLSLGGIGGIIVSMGIAVDANVLIFERMKEEFRAGRTLGAAIEAGFHRAWSAIWDSNVTTFIACIILYWLGSSAMHNAAVTGFAVTLFIGAIVSMFTAVTVTRTLLRMLTGTTLAQKSWLFSVTGGKK
jgi:protein-export membrane protein SecD